MIQSGKLRAVLWPALALAALGAAGAGAADDPSASCLECHADETLALTLDDGAELPLHVAADSLAGSVHAGQLVCTDCHQGYDGDHPSGRTFASRRAYTAFAAGVCKECHFDAYTHNLGSVHFEALAQGSEEVPTCSDCHGAHAIQDPRRKQAMMSGSCARCHRDVYARYASSVHGKALVEEGIDDVPACADCHSAHGVERPRTTSFRLGSPEICIRCHGDRELMARYDLPTDVASSYLADFHGVTASLTRAGGADADQQLVVVCADCHGVHDIASPATFAAGQMQARVAGVCARCHQGAAADFPAAWLSHYRPSLRHAPLVYLIDLAYKVFIPFMVLGLGLQVLLHLYRVAVRR